MNKVTIGALVASAVAGLTATMVAPVTASAADKACYRKHCGKSVPGHEGKCGGTKVDDLKDQKACEGAGGAWTTASEAEAFKKNG